MPRRPPPSPDRKGPPVYLFAAYVVAALALNVIITVVFADD